MAVLVDCPCVGDVGDVDWSEDVEIMFAEAAEPELD